MTLDKIMHYEKLYDDIISKGIEEDFKLQCVKKTTDNTKKKSRKKSKSGNLLERR